MPINVEFHDHIAEIVLAGAIDYSAQEEFTRANALVLSKHEVKEVRVNFAKTSFLDSAGIRALIVLQKETGAKGKSLVLINCSEALRNILEIGGFDRLFKFQ